MISASMKSRDKYIIPLVNKLCRFYCWSRWYIHIHTYIHSCIYTLLSFCVLRWKHIVLIGYLPVHCERFNLTTLSWVKAIYICISSYAILRVSLAGIVHSWGNAPADHAARGLFVSGSLQRLLNDYFFLRVFFGMDFLLLIECIILDPCEEVWA